MAAVGTQRGGEDTAFGLAIGQFDALEHGSAGTVAEQHAGGAVGPVEDAGIGLGADDQRAAGKAVLDEAVGGGNGEDEAGAHRLDVEGGAVMHAELVLHDGGCRRIGEIGRRRRHDDEVDVGDAEAGVLRAPPSPRLPPDRRCTSPSAARWRWRMPVSWMIHSSEVSTRVDISALVIIRCGR